MEGAAKDRRTGRKVAWIGLALTYPILLRASELFAEGDGSVHAMYCLRGGEAAFYAGERQVEGGSIPEVDMVEVRSRRSKGNQGQKGAVLVRTKGGGSKGGETVELLQELYQIHEGR